VNPAQFNVISSAPIVKQVPVEVRSWFMVVSLVMVLHVTGISGIPASPRLLYVVKLATS